MGGRPLHLEHFYNEYDEAVDKSWRITNNLESLGIGLSDTQISKTPKSLIELMGSSSLREREDTLIQEVSHILADVRFEAEDVWAARYVLSIL